MKDKVCVITGANTGIGAVTAKELAARGARVILCCRSLERTQEVLDEIGELASFVALDLADLRSVQKAAEEVLKTTDQIDVLINNAGVAGVRGETEQGFERHFGINHLGHFLFTQLLVERIKETPDARIITVASKAHYRAKGFDFEGFTKPTRTTAGFEEYCVSKVANILFSARLHQELQETGISTYALHPGVVASDIWRTVPFFIRPIIKLFMISTEEGAKTSIYLASDESVATQSGLYWDSCQPKKPSRLARDEDLANELWERSLQWCEEFL